MLKSIFTLVIMFGSLNALAEVCSFIPAFDKAEVKWTGYKFTEKAAVDGKLTKFTVNNLNQSAPNIKAMISFATFEIDGNSVVSGNEARDKSLKEVFFGVFKDQAKISGKVSLVDDKNITIKLKMNGVEKSVKFEYTTDNDTLVAKSKIDLLDFSLSGAVQAINERCKALHTGKDGVAKTWSEVGLQVSLPVAKNCVKSK